jgi:hypothetical protein
VVHTPQFNGKQEEVKAIRTGFTRFASAATFNLRCPRNGKTDEWFPEIQLQVAFSLHHSH